MSENESAHRGGPLAVTRGEAVDRTPRRLVMPLSAGGSTGALAATPTTTTSVSEGDTHVSPMMAVDGGVGAARRGTTGAMVSGGECARAVPPSGSMRGEEAEDDARETARGGAAEEAREGDASEDAVGVGGGENVARGRAMDAYDARARPIDAEAMDRSVENPGYAVVVGDSGAASRPTHSLDTSQARTVEGAGDDEANGGVGIVDVGGEGAVGTRARGPGLTRNRVGGRGGATGSSSTVHGAQRPANSAGDSNTAAVSSDHARAADSTEAQRLTHSPGEGEARRADSGPGNSEEVEGGNMKAAGSLLAVEGAATGAGTEVESKELILPAPTPWDNQEPWDVPRESLETASLELKARADSFKRLENFGTAERAYGHALRFVDQIEMFESEEPSGLSQRNSQLKMECLLEASACAIRRGDPVRAGELAARALAREPENPAALKARALAAMAEGDFGTSIHDLQKALEKNPNDPGLLADLRDVEQRRAAALLTPRRNSAIGSSFIGAPGAVSWGTMPMNMKGGGVSSAQGGQLYSYPNAGYVASGGLGLSGEVEGETDGGISGAVFGNAYTAFQNVGNNVTMDTRAMLDGTHICRPESPSHITGSAQNGSRMGEPGTFNRVGGTPSVSKGTTISMQKNAKMSDAFMLGDESEEEGEEVCGGGGGGGLGQKNDD